MISTRKLAELAGVSQSTVSRSLNDRPEISPETKERVRALAREHGYIVQKKRSKTVCSSKRKAIGILVMHHIFFEDLFLNQLLLIVNSIIEKENYYAMPLYDFSGALGVEKLRDLLSLDLIEGFIIINREYDDIIDQYFKEIGIPHVYLFYHQRRTTKQENVIDTDNFIGGFLATKHLIDLGHRRIATLTSSLDEFPERMNGYCEALKEANIAYDPRLVFGFDSSADYITSYQEVENNLDIFQDATALFAQSDLGALGALGALLDHHFCVPEDISIIGFDGLDIGMMCRPTLTTIGQPFEDLAKQAVERLLQIANHPKGHIAQGKTYLRPSLILRNSTTAYVPKSHSHE